MDYYKQNRWSEGWNKKPKGNNEYYPCSTEPYISDLNPYSCSSEFFDHSLLMNTLFWFIFIHHRNAVVGGKEGKFCSKIQHFLFFSQITWERAINDIFHWYISIEEWSSLLQTILYCNLINHSSRNILCLDNYSSYFLTFKLVVSCNSKC